MVEVAAPVYFSSIVKAAFLHHPSGCRIINEEVTPNGIIAFLPEAIINQQTQGFSTESLVPIGLSKPITGFHIVPANVDIAFSENIIAYTSDCLVSGFQHNGPGMVVIEYSSDYQSFTFHNIFLSAAHTRCRYALAAGKESVKEEYLHWVKLSYFFQCSGC